MTTCMASGDNDDPVIQQETVLPTVRVAGVAVHLGSCRQLDTGVQFHSVAAFNWHLQSRTAGNIRTTTAHPPLTLTSLLSRKGFLGGRLAGGRAVFLAGDWSSCRLAYSRAPRGSRGKLAWRAPYSASASALKASALASGVRKSRPWGQEG